MAIGRGKELQNSVTDRSNLIKHAYDKQTESQWMKEQLQVMKSQNRDRVTHPVHGGSSTVFGGSSGSVTQNVPEVPLKAFSPTRTAESNDPKTFNNAPTRETKHAPTQNESHAPTQTESHAPTMPGPTQWLLPNGMIDACPSFDPNTFQNWVREVKLWKSAQVGANQTQLISKIVTVLPMNMRMEVLGYLENTESKSETRSVETVIQMLNSRYGKN